MDKAKKERLITATERLLARARDDWRAVQRLWRPYVDEGDLDAKACLAHLILWYMSAPDSLDDQMRQYLRDVAQLGHADAIYWSCRWGKKGDSEADQQLLRAGELGSRGAQRDLGALYATGDWTGPKDPALGLHWYRLAAERGHVDAQYNLGFMYLLGEGTEADVNEGLRWLHLSAMQGSWLARHLLADLYRNGYCAVPKNIEEAKRWEYLRSVAKSKLRDKRKRIRLDELRESY
jgi:TPR repeat protein